MISTDITGRSKDNLEDLLAVVADPTAYSQKMEALKASIAENKKYVELVAPASDIVKLRNDTRELVAKVKREAEQTAAKAEADAKEIVDAATERADGIVEKAKQEADEIRAAVAGIEEVASQKRADVEREAAKFFHAQAELDKVLAKQRELNADLEAKIAEVAAEKEKYENLRAEVAEKHQAFLNSL